MWFRTFSSRLAGVFLVLLVALHASAQFTTASLSGTVVDPSGAAVPDTRVTVENVDTGFKLEINSGPNGQYLFARLPVGTYKLQCEKTGFATYVQTGIQLVVNQAATQNVALAVGSLAQQVVVSSDASLVTTDSAAIGQVVTQKQIVDLPLDGRQVQQLVFLSAGATDASAHYCGSNCEGGTYPGEQYAKVNGTFAESINYQMDGVAYNDTYINANLPFPNPDAILEFNLQGTNMSAEYGNAVGGVVNVVTKSGTNQIHGDLFEFVRNGDLNARNFFAPAQDQIKRNQFGVSVGGPIVKDRLFYFGTYQGTRYANAPQGNIAFVPTAQERLGNFSDLPGVQLSSPTTGAPYANNQIPVSQFSPASQYFLKYLPLPNGSGQEINYLGPSQYWADDQFMLKADYLVGKHQISARYFFTNFNQQPFIAKENLLQTDGSGNQVRVQNLALTDTYTLRPNLLFNSWFGWDQQNGGSLSGAPFCMPDAGVAIADTKPCELSLGVGGAFSVNSNHYGAFNRGDQTYREDVTWVKGAHEFHFGAEALRIRAPMANTYEQNGVFSFTNNLSGNNVADFMLGQVSQFIQAGGLYLNFTGVKWSAFAQDNWRASRRLTINMGLRWDPWFPYKDSQGRVACFEPGKQSVRFPNAPLGLLFGGSNHDPGCPSASINSQAANFAPRLGFAYRLTNDNKTSLRGGAGVYYTIPNTVAFQDVVGIPPFAPIIFLTDVSFQNPYGSAGVANPFPPSFGGINKPTPSTAQFPQGPISFTQIFAQNFQLPVVYVWNITFERQLPGSWLFRAGYVGNKGTHLFGTADQESGLFEANPAIYIPGASTAANEQSRRLYPNFGFVNVIDSSINSNYNGLQLTAEKRFGSGFSTQINYTYSKEMDDFAPIGSYNSSTNPFNRHFDYGPSDEDVRNVFKWSGLYRLPQFHLAAFAGKALNGWQLSGIMSWQGGFPFTVYSGVDNSLSGIFEDRADYTGTSYQQAQVNKVGQWLNPSLFQPNAIGTYGNLGKNSFRGPHMFNTNLALIKDTQIKERLALQFRAEAFNAFNNVNFQLYTTNGSTGIDRTQADPTFGQVFSAASPRILQLALKMTF